MRKIKQMKYIAEANATAYEITKKDLGCELPDFGNDLVYVVNSDDIGKVYLHILYDNGTADGFFIPKGAAA